MLTKPIAAMTLLVALATAACQQEAPVSRARSEGDLKSKQKAAAELDGKKKKPTKPAAGDDAAADDGHSDTAGNGDESGDDGESDASGGDDAAYSEAVSAQPITIPGSRGDQMPAFLWKPRLKKGASKKVPAVLLMYGINGDKNDGGIHRAAQVLADGGYIAVTIDWPGTGDRGNISNADRITSGDWRDWTVADYKATLNYLTALPEVDGKRLGYVGASMGAMTGLILTAEDPRVKAMTAIVPMSNPLWGSKSPNNTIASITRPLLCISTDGDGSEGVCSSAGASAQKQHIAGGHETIDQTQVVAATKTFLDAQLKP